MSTTPKTIQIFLPGGDPRGIRVAEITTRIVHVSELRQSRRTCGIAGGRLPGTFAQ
jgi:hypothetical protein